MVKQTVKANVEKDETDTSESSESETSETESSTENTTTPISTSTSAEEVGGRGDNKKAIDIVRTLNSQKIIQSVPSTQRSGAAQKRHRRKRPVTICLTNCRYEVVRQVAKRYGLKEVNQDECWNIYWTDFSVSLERAMDMRRFQIVNHFPGMNEICRKDLLARNLNRMKRLFPKEYDIFPKTWSLPADLGDLQTYAHTRKNKTYICKPEMGCQGRGIFLIRSIKDLNPFGKIICQQYLAKPFLIDNLKFDLRIYVLITSCDPLRVYVFKEGLARFATAKYKTPTNSNTENSYMHLTNYAVNKFSRDYINDEDSGSKRRLTSVYKWLEERSFDTNGLLEAVDEVIVKTIISAHPTLRHNYRTCFPNHDIINACFEILGFDILIDHKMKPFVLEVNHSPSFHTDSKLDLEIKEGLLNDTYNMLNLKLLDRKKVEIDDRKRTQERLLKNSVVMNRKDLPSKLTGDKLSPLDAQFAHEVSNAGGYRLIYPTANSQKYDVFFEQNMPTLYQDTTASQARASFTRTQLEELNAKKAQEENKRVALKDAANQAKDKVRPESPNPNEREPVKPKPKLPKPSMPPGSFTPNPIIASEELERMKGIMQRGMLVRSLGVELQVFKLLCQVRTLKPEEEKIFRRVHGLPVPNLGIGLGGKSITSLGASSGGGAGTGTGSSANLGNIGPTTTTTATFSGTNSIVYNSQLAQFNAQQQLLIQRRAQSAAVASQYNEHFKQPPIKQVYL